ncbi:helix-turn-helix transcriptional regulator [Streptomyces sp. NPDC058947]|uniref:helix-turn-helix domain-containing protein n=1 Tax=Streptomyces sp. NPDC058947 TaxID=3346675 RepID=UPI003696996A
MKRPGVEGMPLSPGQLAALRLAASGYTSRQIAARLNTTEDGVSLRLREAQVRLGARSRTHAAVIALDRGVIRFDELDLPEPTAAGPQKALNGPQRRREGADGAREGRAPVRRPQRRTGDPGEAAA